MLKTSLVVLAGLTFLSFGGTPPQIVESFNTRFNTQDVSAGSCFDGRLDYSGNSGWSRSRSSDIRSNNDLINNAHTLFQGNGITLVKPLIHISEIWALSNSNADVDYKLDADSGGSLTVILHRENNQQSVQTFVLDTKKDPGIHNWGPFSIQQFPDVIDVEFVFSNTVNWQPAFELLGYNGEDCVPETVYARCFSLVTGYIYVSN